MNSKLDSFNKDKVKCQKCKEYFDKENIHILNTLPREILCKNCHVNWIQYGFLATRTLKIEAMKEWFLLYEEFINEQ